MVPTDIFLVEMAAALPADRWRPRRRTGELWYAVKKGDTTKEPVTLVHAWSATWQSPKRNLVLYSVRYVARAITRQSSKPLDNSDES